MDMNYLYTACARGCQPQKLKYGGFVSKWKSFTMKMSQSMAHKGLHARLHTWYLEPYLGLQCRHSRWHRQDYHTHLCSWTERSLVCIYRWSLVSVVQPQSLPCPWRSRWWVGQWSTISDGSQFWPPKQELLGKILSFQPHRVAWRET